jgi:hypothetical protein
VEGPSEGRNLVQAGVPGDGDIGERIADPLEFLVGTSAGAATRR